jgi:AraC-like DNA-binding protein
MGSQVYTPSPPLSEFIHFFWLHEGDKPSHPREQLMPSGIAEFVINLNDNPIPIFERGNLARFQNYRGGILYGAHSEPAVIDTACQDAILGIHFKPGGMFPFFDVPADELHNTIVPLDALWGREADYLRESLLAAHTHAARFRILEAYLLARMECFSRQPAVAFALHEFRHAPQGKRVSDVIDQVGLNPKRLIQMFRQEVGLTPKLYYRVLRFNDVLHYIQQTPSFDWADLALAYGYFDQAHFIHDFRSFAGFTPGEYLLRRNDHFGHIPLYD